MMRLMHGHVLDKLQELPPRSVHTCVTSPPYWNLRNYGTEPVAWPDGWRGSLGLEPTVDRYVAHLVQVFEAVKRVLRDDGTLWLNLSSGYHQKQLLGLEWHTAFALQAAGWILRSDIIWSKLNPMPSSVEDRPTRSHEYLFLLSKQEHYYYNADAIREPAVCRAMPETSRNHLGTKSSLTGHHAQGGTLGWNRPELGRNKRSIWNIATVPLAEAHFAAFPPALVEPCLLAGTSALGACASCGAPYARVVERYRTHNGVRDDSLGAWRNTDLGSPMGAQGDGHWRYASVSEQKGWRPTCTCQTDQVTPGTVLDPFCGAGTTLLVAQRLGRDAIGIDLNATYLDLARRRVAADMPLFYEERPDSSSPLGA
jgi:DNA modification methylase